MDRLTIKRYFWSSVITFLTGFGLVVLTNIDSVTPESFKDGGVLGLLFVAGRAGVKALLEFFLQRK